MTPVVRTATIDDAAQVAELLTELGAVGVDAAEAKRRLERGIEQVIVVDHDGLLLGLVAIKLELYFGHPKPLAHVTALITRATTRRSGVARLLMDATAEFARERSCEGVELTCALTPAREAAHYFYQSLGYAQTSYRYCLMFDETQADGVPAALDRIRGEDAAVRAWVGDADD